MSEAYEPIILKSKIEIDDYVNTRLDLLKLWKRSRLIKGLLIYLGLIAFIAIMLILYGIMTSKENAPYYISTLCTIFILFLIFFGLRWLIRFSIKMYYQSNKLMQKEMTYIITNDSIEFQTESNTSNIKWSELYKIIETKCSMVIYTSHTHWIIPVSCFLEIDLDRFKLLAKQKMPVKKVKLLRK